MNFRNVVAYISGVLEINIAAHVKETLKLRTLCWKMLIIQFGGCPVR